MTKPPGLAPSEVHRLADLTSVVPDSIVSRVLHKNGAGNITLFAFGAGQGLSTHTAPFDAFIQVLSGVAVVTIDGTAHRVGSGECILMPANIPHAIHARDEMTMQLVMLKEKP